LDRHPFASTGRIGKVPWRLADHLAAFLARVGSFPNEAPLGEPKANTLPADTLWSIWSGAATLPRVADPIHDDADRASRAFGLRVRKLRVREGLSQDGLAHTSGIHVTSIGRIERGGREPRLTTILKLAEGIGIEPGELTDGLDVGA
jgi:DNA-binding XRE family transcriptional regulator